MKFDQSMLNYLKHSEPSPLQYDENEFIFCHLHVLLKIIPLIGPRQANLVLIAYASSEGSGEPAHPRSLARTSAARSNKQWVKRNLQTESQIPGPSQWLGMRSWNFHDGMLEDTNSLDGAQSLLATNFVMKDNIFCWKCESSSNLLNIKRCEFILLSGNLWCHKFSHHVILWY